MDDDPERTNSPHDVNDLFDYDVGLDEIFQGNSASVSDVAAQQPAADPTSLGLGLDEEVKVTKKRQPVAKLDEGRLLSQPGIPKLRRTAKQNLRLKGKGHEFADAARLLNFYQLWLDDLFPRAKFADGLTIIEKLGHTKRMQTMRREWIDDEKRRVFDHLETPREVLENRDLPTRLSSKQIAGEVVVPRENIDTRPLQNEADTTDKDLFMPESKGMTRPLLPSHPEPDDDDLDDLLREQDEALSMQPDAISSMLKKVHDDFDAEYEAMNELGM
ncbi:uncharacterized protein N7459_006107 [Penicillium hispanicum]|uniref:uncharacterized protein n=1 Tax=Penicillium hispanicum TaxID=1080232 RepID=UPI00254081A9|nr:uncharacterized protein N7459_006107 [Penicillium hispanicum]KAJ5580122.1 hypothetical protein N7459_006107 [Penicillium hispanicum]